MSTETALLSVRNLSVAFRGETGANTVVRGTSFDAHARETIAIVGESGSGKSVTALSIMGLLDRRSASVEGAILYRGKELLACAEKEMRHLRGSEISMIFQEPMTSLNPILTIGRQIREVLTRHRGMSRAAADAEALRLLDKVRIPAAASRLLEYPHQLSGGMRQRVMIASAVACNPKILIADEPTTALDVTIQAQILDLLKDIQAEDGMAMLFITHDMGVVAEIADRTLVMLRGDVVEYGDTAKIFARPAHNYTRALLAAVPILGAMADSTQPQRMPVIDPASGTETVDTEASPATAPEQKIVLDVEKLSVRFNKRGGLFNRVQSRVHAVEDVSFRVRKGETLALVGESGSGKSTTGRAVLKLVEPEAGRILLNGEDIGRLPPRALLRRRRGMQMIFQDPLASLDPRVTIGAAVAEPMIVHRTAGGPAIREKALRLLDHVGLRGEMAGRYPHELSGGQRQRVCIARALALDPELIVADEAVSALDVSIRAQIINLMMELQERLRLSYLFISHDMAVVERVSHRVAVMYLGEIVEIGPRSSIFGNPQHPYTRRLIASVPVPDPARRGQRRGMAVSELRSPFRAPDYVPPQRAMLQVGADHFVQEAAEGLPA